VKTAMRTPSEIVGAGSMERRSMTGEIGSNRPFPKRFLAFRRLV
jgi:hypothetical protein